MYQLTPHVEVVLKILAVGEILLKQKIRKGFLAKSCLYEEGHIFGRDWLHLLWDKGNGWARR